MSHVISPHMFRNVSASPEDPISTWPYEVYAATLQYGNVFDWRVFANEIRRDPWGEVADLMNDVVHELPNLDASQLFYLILGQARGDKDIFTKTVPGRDPNYESW